MTILSSLWAGIAKPAHDRIVRVRLSGREAHSLPSRWRVTVKSSTARRSDSAAAVHSDQSTQTTEGDEEQTFLASIAPLPAEERQKRIARREWYRQLAERQGIIEAEHQAERNWWRR